jgi:hypothetical protein
MDDDWRYLHVRWGECDDGPRDVETYAFATKEAHDGFIRGVYEAYLKVGANYDFTKQLPDGSFEPDPEHEEEGEE